MDTQNRYNDKHLNFRVWELYIIFGCCERNCIACLFATSKCKLLLSTHIPIRCNALFSLPNNCAPQSRLQVALGPVFYSDMLYLQRQWRKDTPGLRSSYLEPGMADFTFPICDCYPGYQLLKSLLLWNTIKLTILLITKDEIHSSQYSIVLLTKYRIFGAVYNLSMLQAEGGQVISKRASG